jgi:hypothetical protein
MSPNTWEKKSLPSFNKVFSFIRAEEERRIMMFDVPNTKGSAMMITNSMNPSNAMNVAKMVKNEWKKISKDDQFCNYCKKIGYIKETRWKLHGKPSRMG